MEAARRRAAQRGSCRPVRRAEDCPPYRWRAMVGRVTQVRAAN
jgi:hypothetical protein